MSNLEADAKPMLHSMMDGTFVTLTSDNQRALATWAMKTALIVPFTGAAPALRFYEPDDYVGFHVGRVPLPDTYVWLGHYLGSSDATITGEFLSQDAPDGHGRLIECAAITVTLGELAIQVLTMRSMQGGDLPDGGPRWEHAARQIWPASGSDVAWPTPWCLTDDGLEAFAARWGKPA